MPERQEIRPVKLECTSEGQHRFERELWCWVHYIDSQDEPVFWRAINTTGVKCPECGFPGPLPRDIEVKTVVRVVEIDEEGRPLPLPPLEPEYCEGRGRPMPVIRMQPLDEKTRGARDARGSALSRARVAPTPFG